MAQERGAQQPLAGHPPAGTNDKKKKEDEKELAQPRPKATPAEVGPNMRCLKDIDVALKVLDTMQKDMAAEQKAKLFLAARSNLDEVIYAGTNPDVREHLRLTIEFLGDAAQIVTYLEGGSAALEALLRGMAGARQGNLGEQAGTMMEKTARLMKQLQDSYEACLKRRRRLWLKYSGRNTPTREPASPDSTGSLRGSRKTTDLLGKWTADLELSALEKVKQMPEWTSLSLEERRRWIHKLYKEYSGARVTMEFSKERWTVIQQGISGLRPSAEGSWKVVKKSGRNNWVLEMKEDRVGGSSAAQLHWLGDRHFRLTRNGNELHFKK